MVEKKCQAVGFVVMEGASRTCEGVQAYPTSSRAILTAMAIIPSMVSGLLGQNLLDVPFNAYLWQVLALTIIGMLLILYVFVKVGWLKS